MAYLAFGTLLCRLGTDLGMDFLSQSLLQGHELAFGISIFQHHLITAHMHQHKLSHCQRGLCIRVSTA